MKRRILLVIAILLIIIGIFILIKLIVGSVKPAGRGALQVTTNIKGTVFLNNNLLGPTPLCKCDTDETLESGEYNLKIVPDDKSLQSFSAKITINPGVLTAVDRTFLPGALASSYVLTLEKINSQTPQMFISSVPDEALVSIDGESKGVTPYTLEDISASEHEIEIDKTGFAKKTIRIRAVPGYKLILNIILGTENGDEIIVTRPPQASPSAALTPTISFKEGVRILNTPTGFLRVRATPSTGGTEIGQVNPGEIFEYVDENTSWFQIKLTNGSAGWVSKQYAEKATQ